MYMITELPPPRLREESDVNTRHNRLKMIEINQTSQVLVDTIYDASDFLTKGNGFASVSFDFPGTIAIAVLYIRFVSFTCKSNDLYLREFLKPTNAILETDEESGHSLALDIMHSVDDDPNFPPISFIKSGNFKAKYFKEGIFCFVVELFLQDTSTRICISNFFSNKKSNSSVFLFGKQMKSTKQEKFAWCFLNILESIKPGKNVADRFQISKMQQQFYDFRLHHCSLEEVRAFKFKIDRETLSSIFEEINRCFNGK